MGYNGGRTVGAIVKTALKGIQIVANKIVANKIVKKEENPHSKNQPLHQSVNQSKNPSKKQSKEPAKKFKKKFTKNIIKKSPTLKELCHTHYRAEILTILGETMSS